LTLRCPGRAAGVIPGPEPGAFDSEVGHLPHHQLVLVGIGHLVQDKVRVACQQRARDRGRPAVQPRRRLPRPGQRAHMAGPARPGERPGHLLGVTASRFPVDFASLARYGPALRHLDSAPDPSRTHDLSEVIEGTSRAPGVLWSRRPWVLRPVRAAVGLRVRRASPSSQGRQPMQNRVAGTMDNPARLWVDVSCRRLCSLAGGARACSPLTQTPVGAVMVYASPSGWIEQLETSPRIRSRFHHSQDCARIRRPETLRKVQRPMGSPRCPGCDPEKPSLRRSALVRRNPDELPQAGPGQTCVAPSTGPDDEMAMFRA
jgi:hypothetical protein